MAAISATELIKRSLAMLGVFGEGQTLEAYQGEQARLTLNNMFEQWNLAGLTVYNMPTGSFSTVANQASYTIGSGGDINVARPMQIEKMYIRNNDVDYNIPEFTYQQWADFNLKSLGADIPFGFYYETQFPLGKIYLAGIPTSIYTIYYVTPKAFTAISALSDSVTYPDGYGKAIELNLAVELSVFYPNRLRPEIAQMAAESKENLERLNCVKRSTPMDLPLAFTADSGLYTYYTMNVLP